MSPNRVRESSVGCAELGELSKVGAPRDVLGKVLFGGSGEFVNAERFDASLFARVSVDTDLIDERLNRLGGETKSLAGKQVSSARKM